MAKMGDKVIVKTCRGEFRGVVTSTVPGWDNDFLYHVSGDEIVTNTHEIEPDNGRTLTKGPTCDNCKTASDCIFAKRGQHEQRR